ncbi:MAG: hypothetical protein V1875_08610 [Candidatus Altiarchaeota archaeon]
MNSTLTKACMILALAGFAAGAASYEADGHFAKAEEDYRLQTYRNALIEVFLARDEYNESGNIWGMQKCDRLVTQIESSMNPTQIADTYYGIASDYFTDSQDDTEALGRAARMGERCVAVCFTNITCGLRCADLAGKANARINDIVNRCIREAQARLQSAKDNIDDYLNARELATSASAKFSECGYRKGVEEASSVLASIDEKMRNVRMNAAALTDQAYEDYARGDNESCVQNANKSLSLYGRIGDPDGMQKARMILEECEGTLRDWETQLNKDAGEYMQDAYDAYKVDMPPDCDSAARNATAAKGLYQQLYDKFSVQEKDKPTNLQFKTGEYAVKLSQVAALIADIQTVKSHVIALDTAESFYMRAFDEYLVHNYNDARSYVRKAKEMFQGNEDYPNARKCDSLAARIEEDDGKMTQATAHLEEAKRMLDDFRFQEALTGLSKARGLYLAIKYDEGAKKADQLEASITQVAAKLGKANDFLSKAAAYRREGRYEDAIAAATEGRLIYSEIKHAKGVESADKLITEGRRIMDEEAGRRSLYIVCALFVFVVSAALAVQYRSRKSAVEEKLRRGEVEAQEKMRRQTEAMSIRTEEETKTQVETELRRLVDSERKKIDDGL